MAKYFIMLIVILGMTTFPVQKASAGRNDAAAALLLLGGIAVIGAANAKKQKKNRKASASAQANAAARAQNRDVQSALNYFQYPVGTVDGDLGPRSRSAIANFESDMGFAVDGYLSNYERGFLVDSHRRTQNGLYGADGEIFSQQGPRGLLQSYRNQELGIQPQIATNNGFPNNNNNINNFPDSNLGQTPNQVIFPAPDNQVVVAPDVPQGQTSEPTLSMLDFSAPDVSMKQHCQSTKLLTVSNGSMISADQMTNPDQALSEQFCQARQFTSAAGKQQAAGVTASPDQISHICSGMEGVLASVVSAIPDQPVDAILAQTNQAIADAGGSAESMATTSQICLSVGFDEDNPELVAASALLLIASGRTPYGELIGHQLQSGFGFAANTERANEWYSMSLADMDAGATPTILPDQALARNAVIRSAIQPKGMTLTLTPLSPSAGSNAANASVLQPLTSE